MIPRKASISEPPLLRKPSALLNEALLLALRLTQTEDKPQKDEDQLVLAVSSVLGLEVESPPEIPLDQVSWHDTNTDCWIVIYDKVYNVTEFLFEHPGGEEVLLEYAGRDATIAFRGSGHSRHAWQALEKYIIGVLPEHERIFKQGSEKAFENTSLTPVSAATC